MRRARLAITLSLACAGGCGEADELPMIANLGPAIYTPTILGPSSEDFWVIQPSGLQHYDGKAMRRVSPSSPLGAAIGSAATRDRLWFQHNGPPKVLGTLSPSGALQDFSEAVADATSISIFTQGETVVVVPGFDRDLLRLSGGAFTSIGKPSFSLTELIVVGDNDIYALNGQQASHYDGAAWRPLPVLDGHIGTVRALTVTSTGEAWGVMAPAMVIQPARGGDPVEYTDWYLVHAKDGGVSFSTQPMPWSWRDPEPIGHYGQKAVARVGTEPAFLSVRIADGASSNEHSLVANILSGTRLGDDVKVLDNVNSSSGAFGDGSVYQLLRSEGDDDLLLYAGPVHE